MTKTKVFKKTRIGEWYSITIRRCTKQYRIKTRGNLGMFVEYLDKTKVIPSMQENWISYYSIERIESAECPIQI